MSDLSKRMRAASIVAPPDQYTHKGVRYVRGDLAQIDDGRFKSVWWSYGAKYALISKFGECAAWYCMQEGCERRFVLVARQAASTVQQHVENVHLRKKRKEEEEGSSLPASSQQGSEAGDSESLGSYKSLFYSVNTTKFQDQVLRLLIIEHLAFNLTASVEWKTLLSIAHPQLAKVPLSRQTMRRRAKEAYDLEKAKVKAMLNASASKIHISFDMWSSPNRYAIFGVVAHFVRSFVVEGKVLYRNQAVLLAMRRMKAKHDAEQMSKEIIDVVLDYEIGQRLGAFQSDNPTFNDNTVREILLVLDPTYQYWQDRRARCVGHVINLAAKALIFGTDVDAFIFKIAGEAKARRKRRVEMVQKAQEVWRSKGAIGKLHNLVKAIRYGPQRTEYFKKIRIGDKDVDGK